MTQKLKRYDPAQRGFNRTPMDEDVDGEYVKYEDIFPLIEFAKRCALPKLTIEQIEGRKEWTAERSYGNFDDCFSDGQDCSDAWKASEARQVLASVGVE